MEACPTEIWNEIFALACTDAGSTGRSLSLVSRRFNYISAPYKYQALAITQWKQLIAFSQTFPQLPNFRRKIKYLYIHCPYPFLYVENNPRLASERVCLHPFVRDRTGVTVEFSSDKDDSPDSDSDSDYLGDSDSEFDGSLDSDEEQDTSDDDESVDSGSLPTKDTRDGKLADAEIQAVFDKAHQALHAILNATSPSLNMLTLYWTSFRPQNTHDILPSLPFLNELHLFRCSMSFSHPPDNLNPPTALFPRLRLFFMSCDSQWRVLSHSIAIIAPNLTHFRFTRVTLGPTCIAQDSIVTRSTHDQIQTLVSEVIDTSEVLNPSMGNIGQLPESWQSLWSSRVVGQSEVWNGIGQLGISESIGYL